MSDIGMYRSGLKNLPAFFAILVVQYSADLIPRHQKPSHKFSVHPPSPNFHQKSLRFTHQNTSHFEG